MSTQRQAETSKKRTKKRSVKMGFSKAQPTTQ
jgi:hypothetical protein